MSEKLNDIRLEWDGPYSLENIGYFEDKKTSGYALKNSNLNDEDKDYGIYQIYGYHPVYGDNVLLYIGKANDQTFAKRISQESWEYNQDYRNIQIYVGRIYNLYNSDPHNEDDVWSNLIDRAEQILIYAHEPARNSSNILTITRNMKKLKEMENIRVLNYDSHRSLMPEVSGEIWITELDSTKLFGEE